MSFAIIIIVIWHHPHVTWSAIWWLVSSIRFWLRFCVAARIFSGSRFSVAKTDVERRCAGLQAVGHRAAGAEVLQDAHALPFRQCRAAPPEVQGPARLLKFWRPYAYRALGTEGYRILPSCNHLSQSRLVFRLQYGLLASHLYFLCELFLHLRIIVLKKQSAARPVG